MDFLIDKTGGFCENVGEFIFNLWQKEATMQMFKVEREDGEKFDKIFNKFRQNSRDLRMMQMVRDKAFYDKKQRKPNARRKKQIAKAREGYREENLRKSFYA